MCSVEELAQRAKYVPSGVQYSRTYHEPTPEASRSDLLTVVTVSVCATQGSGHKASHVQGAPDRGKY